MSDASAVTPSARKPRRRASRGCGEQLRAEIVAAAKELLAASANSDAVSIRAVADAVGVTSPSIYLHFADKDELIQAVVGDVFAELDVAMVTAGDEVDEPLGKLRAYGLAYVEFAIGHPEHYRVATMDRCEVDGLSEGQSHLDEILADSAFTHFMATVTGCMQAGIFTPGDPVPVTLELWSAAHGIASLMIAKPYLPWGDKIAFADRLLCAAALGHATRDLLGGSPSVEEVTAWLAGQRRSATAGER
ncbi:MAG TPA: TetR/AcrR family transcriptional regulator [Jatrophihabitans sp.]|nr:TetR/AcrR family transcriptional regulator [Jatrophihabitans sp.]